MTMTASTSRTSQVVTRTDRRMVVRLFTLAAALVVYAVLAPRWLEPIYERYGADMFSQASLLENVGFQLWLFAIPVAVILAAIGGALTTAGRRLAWLFGVGGVAAVLIPITVAGFLGTTYGWLFGTGGTVIAVLALLTAWSWAQTRSQLTAGRRLASDLRMGGYMGFAFAAWFTCGVFALPVYALDTAKVVAYDTVPMAMAMAYAMMTFFVLGWLLTYAGQVVDRRHSVLPAEPVAPEDPVTLT